MSNGVLDFLDENVFQPIQGFGEKFGKARFKKGTLEKDQYVMEQVPLIKERLDITNPEGAEDGTNARTVQKC